MSTPTVCPSCELAYTRAGIDPSTGHRYFAVAPHPFVVGPRAGLCHVCNGTPEYVVHEGASRDADATHTPSETGPRWARHAAYGGRCNAEYPGAVTMPNGRAIRCNDAAGHVERDGTRHGNSYAARYWDDEPAACHLPRWIDSEGRCEHPEHDARD